MLHKFNSSLIYIWFSFFIIRPSKHNTVQTSDNSTMFVMSFSEIMLLAFIQFRNTIQNRDFIEKN